MNDDINNNINNPRVPSNGKAMAGIVLLVVGAVLLLKQFDVFRDARWLFSFPMLLVVVGLYVGAKNNFRNLGWVVITIIGGAFLLDDIFPHFDLSAFFWPAAMIGFGVYLILRRRDHSYWDKKDWKRKWESGKYNYNFKWEGGKYGYGGSANPAEPVVDYTVKDETTAEDTQTPPPDPDPTASTGGNYTGD
ncbi:MAG TPA: DUF5668 domain-containing protein, partial [Mucilaginibacter sp.]|nr:DUF5668 domain-containing protein [Mucilaginibacter sp.]